MHCLKRYLIAAVLILSTSLQAGASQISVDRSAGKMRLARGASLEVSYRLAEGMADEDFAMPLVNFTTYGHPRLYITLERNDSTAFVTLLSHDSFDRQGIPAARAIDSGAFVARFRVISVDSLEVSIGDDRLLFGDVAIDADASYEVLLPSSGGPLESSSANIGNEGKKQLTNKTMAWIVLILLLDVLIFIILTVSKRISDGKAVSEAQEEPQTETAPVQNSSIQLFGDLKIIDRNGEDISKKMSPMLQELFLILVCHYPEGGISSASLKEHLWYDKDNNSARNNRSVYMAKLKKILEEIGDCTIERNGDYWSIDPGSVYIDYCCLFDIINSGDRSPDGIRKIVQILSSGSFLSHAAASEWSDRIKSRLADSAVSCLESFLLSFKVKDDPGLVSRAADALFSLDSINETALAAKCKALREAGNHAMAKKLFTSFQKEYSELYGEEFGKSFSDIMME